MEALAKEAFRSLAEVVVSLCDRLGEPVPDDVRGELLS
jgi:hypothetical protein